MAMRNNYAEIPQNAQRHQRALSAVADAIGANRVIGASTCALPEYTWYIRDMLHATTHAGHKEFYRWLLSSKKQLTVFDSAEYPQFLQNNIKNETFTQVGADAPEKPFFSLKDFFKKIITTSR